MRFSLALGIGICVFLPALMGRPVYRHDNESRVSVTFTDIANTKQSPFKMFRMTPDINNSGVVAFEAERTSSSGGWDGLYTATGTDRFTTIVRSDKGPEFAGLSGNVSINKDGVVAFAAGPPYTRRDPPRTGLYVAKDAAHIETIARLREYPEFESFSDPFINDAGTLVCAVSLKKGPGGIYTVRRGERLKSIALPAPEKMGEYPCPYSINRADVVAFQTSSNSSRGVWGAIYTAKGVACRTILSAHDNEFTYVSNPSINDARTIAFTGYLAGNGQGVFTLSPNGVRNTIARNNRPEYEYFSPAYINNSGIVAFGAVRKEKKALYVALPSSDKPIAYLRIGDKLFGSTVNGLGYTTSRINDKNQVAFMYSLENGAEGIARANLAVR